MVNNLFNVRELYFSYGEVETIKNIALEIPKEKITTIIGANGSGKSTLFNLMTKNLKPKKGKIFLDKENIEDISLKKFAQRVAIVHQYNTAPWDITVESLVAYGRCPYKSLGISKNSKEDREKIEWALERTDLVRHRGKLITNLSGGEKQRVWIAMALAQNTEILFLDEPTTYLDVRYQLEILKLIKRLNSEFKLTMVMVLHDINQAIYYSHNIIAMKEGKIVCQGVPEKVINSDTIREIFDVELNLWDKDGKPVVVAI